MKKRLSPIVFAVAILFVIGGYFIYQNYIKVKIDNISTKELKINLEDSDRIYVLSRHEDQESIFQLELTIEGNSKEFITLYLGDKPDVFSTQIRLKDGEISTAHISDWYSDSAYIRIEKSAQAKGELTLSYQFLSLK